MSNILLLGGTGAMGKHLVHLLKDKGCNVYVTSRNQRKSYDNVTYIQGNAHDIEYLGAILNKHSWDVIVDFMIYSSSEFANRVDKLLSSCKQYIFLSSSRVYADSQPEIHESSHRLLDVCNDQDYLRTDEYALSKAREENILTNSQHKNWTIVRPYITYSEIRLQLGVLEKECWLYRALHNRTIVFSKDIAEKTTTLTYGFDVARGIVALMGQEKALGQAFHITVDECHTWKEVFDMYIKVIERETGRKPKVMIIDQNPRVKIPTSKWQVVYDRYYNRRFNNSKINQFIDTTTFKPTLK